MKLLRSCCVIFALLAILNVVHCGTLRAQESRRMSDQPILIGYARGIGPDSVMDYVARLTERMNLGSRLREEMASERTSERIAGIIPKVEDPLYGFAVYMVQGLIPSFETVSFQQVLNEDDARRIMNVRKNVFGDNGVLEDLGNGGFKVQSRYTWSTPLPPDANPKDYESNDATNQNQPSGYSFTRRVIEKDGQKHLEQVQVITTLFRLHEGLLYEANYPELLEMQLPGADAVRGNVDSSRDLGLNAWLDRIPMGIRQLGWNMLNGAAGSQLQQRDDEPDAIYNMRRSSGNMGLALVQSFLFDVDSSEGWIRFADESDSSLQGELKILARKNSSLSGRLVHAEGSSRFAPILNDQAAATLHVCVRLSEEAPEALQAVADWLPGAARENGDGPDSVAAATSAAALLVQLAEHRNLEMLLKIGWTKESDGVIYGGMQLGDSPEFLSQVYEVLRRVPAAGIDRLLELQTNEGLQYIRLELPNDVQQQVREQLGANLTHVFVAHQNSCLWFAAGTENAWQMIRASAARCSELSQGAKTPLISGRIDMEKWLSWPQDDPAGIAQMPYWLDENQWWFPPNPFSISGPSSFVSSRPIPVIAKVFDLGGSKKAGFSLDADEGGLTLRATLGEALANHMVIRLITLQEAITEQSRQQVEEMEAQQKKALEDAMKNAPVPDAPK